MRVSATDLDAYRYYRSNEDADLTAFLAQMRRELPPTEPMLAGTALHSALEVAEPGHFEQLKADGYTFDIAAEAEVDLPAIRELKATREYVIDGCRITLVGKVDGLHAGQVDDHKFTARYDAERFLSAIQWRVYLEVFGADVFRWNVFEGKEIGPRHYRIHAVHELKCYRYPGIGEDVERELRLFLAFAQEWLPERFGRAAA